METALCTAGRQSTYCELGCAAVSYVCLLLSLVVPWRLKAAVCAVGAFSIIICPHDAGVRQVHGYSLLVVSGSWVHSPVNPLRT
jgi:hypothetical protein